MFVGGKIVEDKPIKPTTPPKASAPNVSGPKPAMPKQAPAPRPAVPKRAPTAPKTPTTAQNASADAPVVQNASANADVNVSAEEAKQAEIQSAMQGTKGQDPKKKRKAKKILFLLLLLLLIAGLAVGGAILIPKLLNGDNTEISIEIEEGIEYGDTVHKFSDEVKDYQMGDPIDRGLSLRNNGAGDVFVCFKIEVYEQGQEDTGYPIDMIATPTITSSLWSENFVEETIANKSATTRYYYYNNVLSKKKGTTNTATLFKEYKINAESDIANRYANQTVTVKVTINFITANVSLLSTQSESCWNNAPDAWVSLMRSKTK